MSEIKKSSAAAIFLAWLIVGLPAGWGIYNTVQSSIKLFKAAPPAAQAAPPAQK